MATDSANNRMQAQPTDTLSIDSGVIGTPDDVGAPQPTGCQYRSSFGLAEASSRVQKLTPLYLQTAPRTAARRRAPSGPPAHRPGRRRRSAAAARRRRAQGWTGGRL